MERIPEPELMDKAEQALAYAEADFSDADDRFLKLFAEAAGDSDVHGSVLDLGCGPGQISLRLAREHPGSIVHGLDGSQAMLVHARRNLDVEQGMGGRVRFFQGLIPGAELPLAAYDFVVSNSLLHHLHDPEVFWAALKTYGKSGAVICVMDLLRPPDEMTARELVEIHSPHEKDVLKEDFYNSLLAAFRADEVRAQLKKAGLGGLKVKKASDRHLSIAGTL